MSVQNCVSLLVAIINVVIFAKSEPKSCATQAGKVTLCSNGQTYGCACRDTLFECRNLKLVDAYKCPVEHFFEPVYRVCVDRSHMASTPCAIPEKKPGTYKTPKVSKLDSEVLQTFQIKAFSCEGRDIGRYAIRPCGTTFYECVGRERVMVKGTCPGKHLYNHYTDKCSNDCWKSLKEAGYPQLIQ